MDLRFGLVVDRVLKRPLPDVVGIACLHAVDIPEVLALAAHVRRLAPGAFILVGGHSASVFPDPFYDSDVDAATRERDTLERRRDLRSTQRRRIAQLLAQNESALTALDRTATALADVPIGKQPEDADAAMAALEELADRATKYA